MANIKPKHQQYLSRQKVVLLHRTTQFTRTRYGTWRTLRCPQLREQWCTACAWEAPLLTVEFELIRSFVSNQVAMSTQNFLDNVATADGFRAHVKKNDILKTFVDRKICIRVSVAIRLEVTNWQLNRVIQPNIMHSINSGQIMNDVAMWKTHMSIGLNSPSTRRKGKSDFNTQPLRDKLRSGSAGCFGVISCQCRSTPHEIHGTEMNHLRKGTRWSDAFKRVLLAMTCPTTLPKPCRVQNFSKWTTLISRMGFLCRTHLQHLSVWLQMSLMNTSPCGKVRTHESYVWWFHHQQICSAEYWAILILIDNCY